MALYSEKNKTIISLLIKLSNNYVPLSFLPNIINTNNNAMVKTNVTIRGVNECYLKMVILSFLYCTIL